MSNLENVNKCMHCGQENLFRPIRIFKDKIPICLGCDNKYFRRMAEEGMSISQAMAVFNTINKNVQAYKEGAK